MKKIILLILLLCATISFAQGKDSVDTVSRYFFNAIKSMKIETKTQANLLVKNLDSLEKTTYDKELIKSIQKQITILNNRVFENIEFNINIDTLKNLKNKKIDIDFDKYKKRYVLHNKPHSPYFYLYGITSSNSELYLRLVIVYFGSDWVFAEKLNILIDNEVYEIDFTGSDREVLSGGSVTETLDILVDKNIYNILQKIITQKDRISMRFEGKKWIEMYISTKEIENIKYFLDFINSISKK